MEERLKIETLNGLKYFLADQKADAIELCLIDIDGDMTNDELAIVSYLIDNFDQLQSHVKNIVLEVPYEKISKRDFETFLKLYEKTSSSTIDLKFCVLHRLEHGFSKDRENIYWDFETIAKANKQIDHVCEFLKSSNLSPFEMLAFIHDYVSCLVPYTELPGKREWVRLNQFFPGAYLNSPDFICSGFSTLMEEIIDNLNIISF